MAETKAFPSTHPFDRTFLFAMLVIAWVAILSGFINDIVTLFAESRLHFPWIVHIHGVVFFGWLVLFTVQVLLIRNDKLHLHKQLGVGGAVLAGVMVILGTTTAIVSESVKYGTKYADTAFLSIMLGDMLIFAGLITAAIWLRNSPVSHKRLMLIATLVITDAGFGRGLGKLTAPLFGNNYWTYPNFVEAFWPFVGSQLFFPCMLIFAVGIHDLFTRGRLQPAYVWGVVWYLTIGIFAGWLYFSPAWRSLATSMIGH